MTVKRLLLGVWIAARRLSLGVGLIALTSGLLLISDWKGGGVSEQHQPRVAILQHASQPLLDEGVQGMVEGLAAGGFVDGKNMTLQRFNAENDVGTANAIARQLVSGGYDMVLTSSTRSLQAVANANQDGKVMHVFGVVADPYAAIATLDRANPLAHPPHLVGIGSFIPVDRAFQVAREMFPGLRSVGVAWNPSEANSEAFTLKAREVCREMGIKLVEAAVDNSSAVGEAARSLVARGVQALWIGGDVTVAVAAGAVIAAGREGHIPVFSITPPTANRGALFDYGADFHVVGREVGELAAQILHGADPAKIPIRNEVPPLLVINKKALQGLKDPWRLPPDLLARADEVIDETGSHKKALTLAKPPAGRVFKIGLVYFAPEAGADSCMKGFFDGLRELGFAEGKNLDVRRAHAQGEISNIPAILQNFDSLGLDLIVPLTTPCLTAACTAVKHTPVVFTYVYDPIAAGAGKTRTDHVPNITGVGSFPPVADTIDVMQRLVPGLRVAGTLYNSSEANSRKVVSVARDLFHKRGIRLEEVSVSGSSEVYQAAQALVSRRVQAFWITGDNTAIQGFDGIVKVTTDARLPLIINDPEFTQRGALACIGVGFYKSGFAAAKLAARVLLGERPQDLPIEEVSVKQVVLNFEVAKRLGIQFPKDLIQESEK